MRAWQVVSDQGIEALEFTDRPEEALSDYSVRVQLRAASLNYRDLGITAGGYYRNNARPIIPLSDAAGEVIEVGSQVSRWKPGDRVCPIFVQDWLNGPPSDPVLWTCLGGSIDGVLTERRVLHEQSLVRIPAGYSFEQASTLPCAAVTAWHALFESGNLQAGETVLLLGTGGVSIFALQFAKAAGARVIITSSSDEKLQKAREWGADETINYRQFPDWEKQVHELTQGAGVDHVVEVGGPGTLEHSLKSTRVGGSIHLIGVLDSPSAKISPLLSLFNCLKIQGIYVGSRAMFERMNRAIEVNGIEPVIHSRYTFENAQQAYRDFATQQHMGKVVITIP